MVQIAIDAKRQGYLLSEQPTQAALSRTKTWLDRLQHLYSSKLIVAGILALMLFCYFWNAPHAIDDPEYDESYYLRRAVAVTEGNIIDANLGDLRNSPMMVLYYAAGYSLFHSTAVYNWVLISGVCLMAYAAYLLFLRQFSPLISGAFSLLIVVASTPQMPDNMRFAVGTGLLWFSLYLLSGKVRSRAIALLVLILAIYVRPEYLTCLLVLLPGLAYYEWQQARRQPSRQRNYTLLVYLPVIIALLFTGFRLWQLSAYEEPRIVRTIPFSYVTYIQHFQPDRIDATKTSSDQSVFADDFEMSGKVTLPAELIAMTTHLDKALPYLTDTMLRLWGAFSAATFDSWAWRLGDSYVLFPTLANTLGFALLVLVFGIVGVATYRSARRRGCTLPRKLSTPSIFGYAALAMLIPWMLLANPDQRAFMILPLVLLPVGVALTAIACHIYIPRWLPIAAIFIIVIILPRPFNGAPMSQHRRDTLTFIHDNIPQFTAVMGTPIESYANSLYADHFVIEAIEGTNFDDPVLVNAYKAHPEMQYVLLTYFYPQDYYTRWFAEWSATYPNLHWKLITEKPELTLKLYHLEK